MSNTKVDQARGESGAWRRVLSAGRFARTALAVSGMVWALAACGSPAPITAEDGHIDLVIGASEIDGGELVADYDFDLPLEVFETATIGGFTLWSGTDPGFAQSEFDDPNDGFFALADGVTVSIEVTALEAGMQFRFGDVTVNEVGESVVLGTVPELHGHGEWQVALPEGVTTGQYPFSFRFIADSTYAPSRSETALLTPVEGEGHDDHDHGGDHDEHDHDGGHDGGHDGDHDDEDHDDGDHDDEDHADDDHADDDHADEQ